MIGSSSRSRSDGSQIDIFMGDILSTFRGREDYYTVNYAPVEGEPDEYEYSDHIDGAKQLGFYLLDSNSQCRVSCIDIDNHGGENPSWWDQTICVHDILAELGIPTHIEISSSGNGAHLWVIFSAPIPGWEARAFWKAVESRVTFDFVEIFPKQDRLDENIRYGNFVRYPYYGKSHFTDRKGDEIVFSAKPVSPQEIHIASSKLGVTLSRQKPISDEGNELPPKIETMLSFENSVISRLWRGEDVGLKDKSRSARVQAISNQMVRNYLPPNHILIALKYWARENDYEKPDKWFLNTVNKSYDFLSGGNKSTRGLKTSVDCAMAYVDKLKDGGKLIPSGIPAIDESVEGVSNGEVCIIAARPGNGKSALALQWLTNATKLGHHALLLSAEMSATEVGKRVIMHNTDLPEDLWVQESDQIRDILVQNKNDGKLWIEDVCQSIDDIERLINTHANVNSVSIVAIDYMQLISTEKSSRYESVTEISQRVKAVSKRNDVAVLALCQMNRQSEYSETWNPQLSDLKESGQLEQDADLVMFSKWGLRDQEEENYYFKFAKRRNGNIRYEGTVCTFDAQRQLFRSPKK